MAGIPIPIKSEYPKETVEVLKSINTVLGTSEKYEKAGLEVQTQLQKDLSGTRKKYIDTNVEIQKLLKGHSISNDLAREMQEKNRNELVKGFGKVNEIQLVEGQKNAIDTQLAIGYLTTSQRESLEAQKKSLEIQEQGRARDEEILKLAQRGFISKKQEKYLKLKNKATTYLNKFLVKKKWLQTVGKSLKTMAQNAGSWIMQLLKFLFVMALFPGLLDTIVNIFISVATTFIKILAKHLPRIIGALIKIITVVLPRALIRIIDSLFPIIGEMFKGWAKKLEKKYPFFSKVLNWIGSLFGKNGTLTKFFKSLASLAPVFIGIGVAIKLIMTLTAVLNPFVLVVTGLVIAITYLKSIWDNSAEHFKKSEKAMKGMTEQQEMFYRMQQKSSDMTQTLGRAFEVFKKEGLGAALKDYFKEYALAWGQIKKAVSNIWKKIPSFLWKSIKKFVKFIWKKVKGIGKFLKKLFLTIFSPVISVFRKVFGFFKDIFQPVIKTMAPVFKKIGEILDWIWDGVISGITKVLKGIKKTISDIFNWFGGVGTFGAYDWMKKSEEDKKEYTTLATRLDDKGINMGDLKAWGSADEDKRQEMFDSGQMTKKEIATFEGMKSKSGLSTDDFEDIMDRLLKNNTTKDVKVLKKTIKSWVKSRPKGKK